MSSRGPGLLLMGNHAPPYGGVPNHIGHLARHLSARGWRVHVLSENTNRKGSYVVDGYWVHAPSDLSKLRNVLRKAPQPALRGVRLPLRAWVADVARANAARRLVRRHDLRLISAYHVLQPGLAASWVAEQEQIPLVTTVFGELYSQPEVHRTRLADVRRILGQSSLVLSCSRHCADSLQAVLGISADVGVLYYGVDVDRFLHARSGASDDCLGWSHEDRVILYVGRMVDEMGLGVLLEALPVLLRDPSVRIVIAGASGHLRSRAEAASVESGGRVRVLPDVSEHRLTELYQSADVVATPSINERACLGLAIVEAMAAGKPVVACAIGGTAEVLVDGVTGLLVPPGDPEALAGALLRLVNDRSLSAALGAAGRARAVQLFDVRHTNRAAEELFMSALAAPAVEGR